MHQGCDAKHDLYQHQSANPHCSVAQIRMSILPQPERKEAREHCNEITQPTVMQLDGGAAMAEAASFALSEYMSRSEAQAEVKKAAMASRGGDRPMVDLLAEATGIPGLDDRVGELARQGSGREIIDRIVARARK